MDDNDHTLYFEEICQNFPNKDIVLVFMRILVDEFNNDMLYNKKFDMGFFEDIMDELRNWAQFPNEVEDFIDCLPFLDRISQKYRLPFL